MELRNVLYYGDNLDVLRRHVNDESVDLVYLDPPFNSNQNYNVLFAERGTRSAAQIKAFGDTWRWDESAAQAYAETVEAGGDVSQAMRAFRTLLGTSDMLAYLSMMAPRLVQLQRSLKPTGSLYLHCDAAASHYLKLLLDSIFGPRQFLNEITWKRTTAHNDPQRYGRISDRLLFYSKTAIKTFNRLPGAHSPEQLQRYRYQETNGRPYRAENLTAPHYSPTRTIEWRGTHPGANRQWRFSTEELERLFAEGRILAQRDGRPRKDGLKEYLDEAVPPALQDVWTDIGLGPTASERLGYPTQKPEALLERIIATSSNEGEIVLDPFCGCGTAIAVAQRLKRRWVGIDITHLAVNLIRHRLQDTYGEKIAETYRVIGEPTTLDDAEQLAHDDPYQFQWWALGLVGARPVEQKKKGADKGIDGRIFFHDEAGGKTKQIILSVKAGKTGRAHVHELRGVVEREGAEIGALITLQESTQPMREDASSAGFYTSPGWGTSYPRLQLLTVGQLLEGKTLAYPHVTGVTFKKAPKAPGQAADQLPLDVG